MWAWRQCGVANTTHAWERCRYVLSDNPSNVSDGPVACLIDRMFVHGFVWTLHYDSEHFVSAWASQDYPKSMRCLD